MISNRNRLSNVSQKMNAHWQPVWLKVRSPSRFTVVAFLFLFVLTTSCYRFGTTSYAHSEGFFSSHVADATNSTLGFQTILALSQKPSWRTRGLEAAASLTGLTISVPAQPQNSQEFIKAFERIGADTPQTRPSHGSAKAWLAHLDMLKYVVASRFTTAFIIEDDVDWDVDIKAQIRVVSTNVRNLTKTPTTDPNPYGSGWDVLWLGNCGERSMEEGNHIDFLDTTRIPGEDYAGWAKQFVTKFVPKDHRRVQEASNPVCTFGYGITHTSAKRIVTLLSRASDEAFDVALQHHCVGGKLRCVVVTPELFHHYEPPKDFGYVSGVHEGDGQGSSADEEAFESVKGSTANIAKSARCQALFQGTCLAPSRDV